MVIREAVARNSNSTQARASNIVSGETGRFSRHSEPRPSRHQALTPKSRAPPEATSPGRIVIDDHGRLPKIATRPGPTASTMTPRRMGTERHTDARSVRTRMPSTERGRRRGGCRSVSIRASSRAIRRAAR
jgi:hypothetical protein